MVPLTAMYVSNVSKIISRNGLRSKRGAASELLQRQPRHGRCTKPGCMCGDREWNICQSGKALGGSVTYAIRPFLPLSADHWVEVKDGDKYAREMFQRHYSHRPYADGRKPKLFCGPEEKIVLMTIDGKALFVGRKFKSADNQDGINCSIFRNESDILSSQLILESEKRGWERWSSERLYTHVKP